MTGFLMSGWRYPTAEISVPVAYRWATVVDPSPLTIQLDGDTLPLASVPDSLVDPALLTLGDRVWVQLHGRKVIVLGSARPFTYGPTGNMIRVAFTTGYGYGAGVWQGLQNGVQVELHGDPTAWSSVFGSVGVTVRDAGVYALTYTMYASDSSGEIQGRIANITTGAVLMAGPATPTWTSTFTVAGSAWLAAGTSIQAQLYNQSGLTNVKADGTDGYPVGLTVHQVFRAPTV